MAVTTLYDAEGNEVQVDLEDAPSGDDSQRSGGEWAKLRRVEKERKAAADRAEQAERRLAFYAAGLNPDDPRMTYFVKGYDGDLTVDRVREAAAAAGLVTPPPDQEGQAPPDPVDAAAHQSSARITNAAAGALPDQRSPEQKLADAYAQAGAAGLTDALREMGAQVVSDRTT